MNEKEHIYHLHNAEKQVKVGVDSVPEGEYIMLHINQLSNIIQRIIKTIRYLRRA